MKVKKFKFDRKQVAKKLKIEVFIDCLAKKIKEATGAEDHQADEIANAYWNALNEEIEFPELADQIEFASMAMCVLLWGYQIGYADGVYVAYNKLDGLNWTKMPKAVKQVYQHLDREWRDNDYAHGM